MFFLTLVWGSSFILIKKGVSVYPPVQAAFLRIGISALAFTPIVLYRFRKIDWSRWYYLLIVGLSGSSIPAFLFATAQQHISSAMAGILNALTPVFTLVIGIVIFKAPTTWKKVTGVLLGLAGAVMLVLMSGGNISGNAFYGLLIVLATMCYGTSVNTVGYKLQHLGSLTISAAAFSFLGVPSWIYLACSSFPTTLTHHPDGWMALGAIALLALVSTVLASVLYFKLVQWNSPVFASMVSYLAPIISIGWGVLDGEAVSAIYLVGLLVILAGVYLTKG